MEHRIAILLLEGFTDSGLAVAHDVLRCANTLAARAGKPTRFVVDVCSPRGGPLRAASGLSLQATHPLRRASRAEVILMPGVWVESPTQLDLALARPETRLVVRALAAAHARGATIASACSGAFFLAAAGLLDGRHATTTWWLAEHLSRRHPKVRVDVTRALIADGPLLTGGAVFAQADVALSLVARFAGPSIARQCASVLLLDPHTSQAPYMAIEHLRANDKTVRKADSWVRAHLHEPLTIPAVAKHLGVSPRTLARRLEAAVGMSPLGFIQHLRVETAVHLLRTTRLSLAEISARVGYSDAGALRRLLQRETSASPRDLRLRRPHT